MCFRTGILLAQSRLSSFYTQKLFFFYFTQILLCRDCSHRGIDLYRHIFYTDTFTKKCSLRRFLLQRDAFTRGCFWTRTLLGREILTWARLGTQFRGEFKPFWNQVSIHSRSCVCTQKMLAERCFSFTHKRFKTHILFTEMMLQRGAFGCSRVYTQVPSHRGAF